MLVAVISDTHVPDFTRALPRSLDEYLGAADLILHAGDSTTAATLAELALHAPLHAALGNIDRPDVADWGALPEVRLTLDGVRVSMLHDAGPARGRAARLRRRFPDADVVVYGHSHIPQGQRDGDRWLPNPGGP